MKCRVRQNALATLIDFYSERLGVIHSIPGPSLPPPAHPQVLKPFTCYLGPMLLKCRLYRQVRMLSQ
jgi:hypothetical protein